MSWFDLLLGGLLTARLTRLVAADTILDPARRAIKARAPHSDVWDWVDELIECRWCSSVWIAAAVAALWHLAPSSVWVTVAAVGAWSLVCGLIARLEE